MKHCKGAPFGRIDCLTSLRLGLMYELPVKIERFENQFAILRNDMTGEFKWPTSGLPLEARGGDDLILTAHLQKNREEEKYSNMRVMLEELIN